MVATSLTAQTRSSTHRPAAAARWFRRHAKDQQGKPPGGNRDVQLLSAAGVAAVLAWCEILQARVVQLRHRTGGGAAWHQPSRPPRQGPTAVNLMVPSFSHGAAPARPPDPPQPVQLRCHRPGALLQILQVAAAVERPAVDAARPAAPIAGLRGARMGVVGPRPADTSVGLAKPRAGRDGNLPGPAGLPAAHQVSPPLAWLPAPTNPPSRRARPSRSRIAVPPYAPVGRACPARSGCGRRPEGERATAVAPPTAALRPVGGELPARVGPTRPTNRVLDSFARGRSRCPGWHSTGLNGDLECHIHDQQR
jgi:hypothetical protein